MQGRMGGETMKAIMAVVGLWIVASAVPAHAEMSAKDLISEYRAGNQWTAVFILGIENGLGWEESYQDENGGVAIFCQPGKLALTVEQDVDITSRYVAANPKSAEYPFGMALLLAMKDTFPCKPAK
jgi:hypothetical protein